MQLVSRKRDRGGVRKSIAGAAIPILFMVVVAVGGPAAADAPGESDESAHLVREALALIVNTPDNMAAIEEKIDDALKAPKQDGVDLGLVAEAKAAFPPQNMHDVRVILERSIGAQPHRGPRDPLPIRETRGSPGMKMATGTETGTDVVVDPLTPDRSRSAGDWLALTGFAVVAAVGVWFAIRFRPRSHHYETLRP